MVSICKNPDPHHTYSMYGTEFLGPVTRCPSMGRSVPSSQPIPKHFALALFFNFSARGRTPNIFAHLPITPVTPNSQSTLLASTSDRHRDIHISLSSSSHLHPSFRFSCLGYSGRRDIDRLRVRCGSDPLTGAIPATRNVVPTFQAAESDTLSSDVHGSPQRIERPDGELHWHRRRYRQCSSLCHQRQRRYCGHGLREHRSLAT